MSQRLWGSITGRIARRVMLLLTIGLWLGAGGCFQTKQGDSPSASSSASDASPGDAAPRSPRIDNRLVGQWEYLYPEGGGARLEFREDGTLSAITFKE